MLYIRADANPLIATGHIMRCMTIANEFRKHGEDITFIIADKNPCELLEREKYKYICLNSEFDNLDNEIEKMIACIKDNNITKLLIDSYYVTECYLSQISKNTMSIYIDDLANFIYPVHMIINYNNYCDTLHYTDNYKYMKTKLLLGCKYTPLREEFSFVFPRFGITVKKVLLTTGGADTYNVAGKFLSYYMNTYSKVNLEFHIVIGKFNNNLKYLQNLKDKYHNIQLHTDVTKISEVMTNCDIAITAGGFTMYELCACAVPMITYSFADNQLFGVNGFERLGIAKYCGDVRKDDYGVWKNIYNAIKEYQENIYYRKQTFDKMLKLVDGHGASRLYEEINNKNDFSSI